MEFQASPGLHWQHPKGLLLALSRSLPCPGSLGTDGHVPPTVSRWQACSSAPLWGQGKGIHLRCRRKKTSRSCCPGSGADEPQPQSIPREFFLRPTTQHSTAGPGIPQTLAPGAKRAKRGKQKACLYQHGPTLNSFSHSCKWELPCCTPHREELSHHPGLTRMHEGVSKDVAAM